MHNPQVRNEPSSTQIGRSLLEIRIYLFYPEISHSNQNKLQNSMDEGDSQYLSYLPAME